MKKVVKLKESELIDLIKKAVNEQHEEPSSEVLEDYLHEIDQIYRDIFVLIHSNELTQEDLDGAIDDLNHLLNYAEKDDDITDDEFETLYQICDDMIRDMDFDFEDGDGLNEGTKAKKPKSVRSRRSGIKTMKTINKNHEILKKFN
jgi:hypothetical protein